MELESKKNTKNSKTRLYFMNFGQLYLIYNLICYTFSHVFLVLGKGFSTFPIGETPRQ